MIDNQKQLIAPDLFTLLGAVIESGKSTHYNCLPATIVSFDAATQTAKVSVNMKQFFPDSVLKNDGTTSGSVGEYPLLFSVPCIWLCGGASYLTFPIAAGDTGVLLFADRNIDIWKSTGDTSNPPPDGRLHDISDGIMLVGLHSLANKKTNYSGSSVQLGYGSTVIDMTATTCTVTAQTLVANVSGNMTANVTGDIIMSGATISLNP